MKDRYTILVVIGFLSTLAFEFLPSGVYKDWFPGADIVYPDGYEEKTGTPSVSLQHYVNNISEYFHILMLYIYILINSKQKSIWLILTLLFFFSLLNYIYNNHMPIFGIFDMNYIIGIVMVVYSSEMAAVKLFKNTWKK